MHALKDSIYVPVAPDIDDYLFVINPVYGNIPPGPVDDSHT